MKSLLATSALAVVILAGSPAMAQSITYDPESSGAAYAFTPRQSQWNEPSAAAAFAQAPLPQRTRPVVQRRSPAAVNPLTNADGRAHSPNPAYDVYDTSGNYIGSDPDVAIRNELMRDPPNRGD